MDRIKILGLNIDRVTMTEALETIERYIEEGKPRHVVTADASMVVLGREDPQLWQIANAAELVTPDGAGILWASRLLRVPVKHKVSGVDLVKELCRLSAIKGYRVYFLGAAPGVADAAAEKLRLAYPGSQIVGTRNGFFKPEDEDEIVKEIVRTKADVLFVAFGIPKQEKFITRHKEALGVPVSIGVGGSFDVYSGLVQRAPVWMQNAGLEWAFRLWQNPKKISKVMTLPRFVVLAVTAKVFGRAAA